VSRYVLTPDAETDLREIRDWYRTERGHEAARRVLQDLRAAMRRLARNPRIGHPRPDLLPAELLVWPHYRYLIVYRPETKPLQVVRVWDASRGTPNLF
jgi:plasmid stabilization system protein ParE